MESATLIISLTGRITFLLAGLVIYDCISVNLVELGRCVEFCCQSAMFQGVVEFFVTTVN